MRKYELTDETIEFNGHILHRIRALRAFSYVEEGDLGGFIESEINLAHDGNCWVSDNAKVFDYAQVSDNAKVSDNALVFDYAQVFGKAEVCGEADIFGYAKVCDNALVFGRAEVDGNALVRSTSDYIVFKNWWERIGRYFTWTRSNNMWRVGVFHGTREQLIAEAHKESEQSGREYERVVKYVESILADEQKEGGAE